MKYIILLCFIAIDILTGILKGYKTKFKSAIMRDGLIHKATEIIIVALAKLIDVASCYMDMGFTFKLVTPCIIYICIMETHSILENIQQVNPQLIETIKGLFKNENK